ncbi:twin-arginine translocase subunit TatC [Candidatus Marinimicrobia bacterium]|nr:twin-arginine translocase subunit TatC [Candidatus Neomarinimicrobiota bacterium]
MTKTIDKPFFDHLEEMRNRIIKSLLSIILFSILGYIYSDKIIELLVVPVSDFNISFQVLKITSIFLIKIGISLIFGILFPFPVLLYQFLKFILPAFGNKITLRRIFIIILFCLFLFLLGLFFGYFILIPLSISFFSSLSIDLNFIEVNYTLENYLVYLIWILIISSFIFQLPFILLILNKIGIIDRKYLINHRRHIIVLFFIFAAFFTPPDPISQILVVIPLYILFEISVLLIRINK